MENGKRAKNCSKRRFPSEKNVYYKWENISLLLFKSVRRFRYRKGFEASLFHTLCFLLGFSVIFIALGYGTSFIGSLFRDYHDAIRQIGALLIILFGFITLGVFRPEAMMKERRIHFKHKPSGFLGSVLIGMAFAAGWTPCTGPILAAVITLAGTNPGSAVPYMMLYVLGFAVPFLLLSFFITKLKWIRKNQLFIMKAGGVLMIVIGVLLFFNWMSLIIILLSDLFGGFTGF